MVKIIYHFVLFSFFLLDHNFSSIFLAFFSSGEIFIIVELLFSSLFHIIFSHDVEEKKTSEIRSFDCYGNLWSLFSYILLEGERKQIYRQEEK